LFCDLRSGSRIPMFPVAFFCKIPAAFLSLLRFAGRFYLLRHGGGDVRHRDHAHEVVDRNPVPVPFPARAPDPDLADNILRWTAGCLDRVRHGSCSETGAAAGVAGGGKGYLSGEWGISHSHGVQMWRMWRPFCQKRESFRSMAPSRGMLYAALRQGLSKNNPLLIHN